MIRGTNNVDHLPLVPLVVNSSGDAPDADLGDGLCRTGAEVNGEPECTLRAAITQANTLRGRNMIFFAIAGSGEPRITPASPLPTITEELALDGSTQPGAGRVRISGGAAGRSNGIGCTAGGDTFLVGLDIDGFSGYGVYYKSGQEGSLSLIDVRVRGNGGWGLYQASRLNRYPLLVKDSVFHGNLEGGLYLRTGLGPASKNITITGNGGHGIFNDGGVGFNPDVVVGFVRIVGNGGDGIHSLSAGDRVVVGGSTDQPSFITDNDGRGVNSAGDAVVVHTRIKHNGGSGIDCGGEDGAILLDVEISGNGGHGIRARQGIFHADGLRVTGNGGDGIHVVGTGNRSGPFSGIYLDNSVVYANSGTGLMLEKGNAIVAHSRIHDNTDNGVVTWEGNVTGGDLKVIGNQGHGMNIGGDATLDRSEICRNTAGDLVVGGHSELNDVTAAEACETIAFNATPPQGTAPLTVAFSESAAAQPNGSRLPASRGAASNQDVIAWYWDFGDGTWSLGEAPSHTYAQPGTYTVTFSQTLADGRSRSEIRTTAIKVTTPCATDGD